VRKSLLILALVCFPAIAFAQGGSLGSNSSPVVGQTGQPLAGVSIAICTHPATIGNSTTPCSPLANTYTDNTLGTQCNGSNGCTNGLTTSDGIGNWNFWVTPAVYDVQFYGSAITTTLKTYAAACVPGAGTGTCGALLNGNNAWTGNETHSGTETFNAGITGSGTTGALTPGTGILSGNNAWTGNETHSGAESFTDTTPSGSPASPPISFQGTGANPGITFQNNDNPGVNGDAFYIYWNQYNSAGTLKRAGTIGPGYASTTAGAEQFVFDFNATVNGIGRTASFGGVVGGGNHAYITPADILGYWDLGLAGQGWSRLRLENDFDATTPPVIELRDTQQSLPLGLFRVTTSGGGWFLQRNTAAGGNFSSTTTPIQSDSSDQVTFATSIQVTSVTVASLPTASGKTGQWRTVNDSTAIASEGQTCAGGGSVTAAAFSNGTVWKCF
jgi:hypothetical protein